MVIETSTVDRVWLACDSEECGGRETGHDATTVAYWDTPDSGTLVDRKSCSACSRTTAVRQWVGPARQPSHDCGYYTDGSGVCQYCCS
jgi:hypothetical protein